jgi:AraC-like DNA-binding protein
MQFSTDRVRPSQRAHFWRDVCNGIIEVDCRINSEDFSGSIEFTALGNSPAFLVAMDTCLVERSARHVASAAEPPVLLIHEQSGRIRYEAGDREFTYGNGQFVLIDTAIPYQAQIGANCRQLIMAVDHRALTLRLGDYRRFLGRPVSADKPLGALACAMLGTLPRSIQSLDPVASLALESQVMDLVAMALARDAAGDDSAPVLESAPMIRLNAAVDAAVINAARGADEVAAHAGMSLQEANLLLRRNRVTLPELLHARRLDRSRDRLALAGRNPAVLPRIAAEAGFADISAFHCAFRDRFGEDPA